jgi:hypothetical protein
MPAAAAAARSPLPGGGLSSSGRGDLTLEHSTAAA